jgi:hypothetical protein
MDSIRGEIGQLSLGQCNQIVRNPNNYIQSLIKKEEQSKRICKLFIPIIITIGLWVGVGVAAGYSLPSINALGKPMQFQTRIFSGIGFGSMSGLFFGAVSFLIIDSYIHNACKIAVGNQRQNIINEVQRRLTLMKGDG